jgi:predicted nucleotide-binding protein
MQTSLDDLKNRAEKYSREIEVKKPRVFIGSSSEGLYLAEMIQFNLRRSAYPVIWSQGVFGLSEGTLESLVKVAPTFDYAILVLTMDDLVTSRRHRSNMPRDNVLFELGLFVGVLGREKTFMVHAEDARLKLPSDLAGVSIATFAKPPDGNLSAALGPVATQIKLAMGIVQP